MEHFVLFVITLLIFTASAARVGTNHAALPAKTYITEIIFERQQVPAGLSYDRCTEPTDCVPPRSCVNASNATTNCSEEICRCVPPGFRSCISNEECISGEVCGKSNSTVPHCVSAAHVDEDPEFDEVPGVNGTGLSGDLCSVTDDCISPRRCVSGVDECNGESVCICLPPIFPFCSSSSQCVPGERCLVNDVSKRPFCQISHIGGVEWNSSRGLTWDFCRSTEECAGSRTCKTLRDFIACKEGFSCACAPESITRCTRSSICVDGEICADRDGVGGKVCVSEQAAPYHDMKEVETALGLSGDTCFTSQDCKPPRECIHPSLSGQCEQGSRCICAPPGTQGCESNSDCKEGEICVQRTRENVCLKESAALETGFVAVGNETEDTDKSTPLTLPAIQRRCIASNLLRGLGRDDLVFGENVLAHVLCDASGNCATPGHVVVFKGKAMMMKSHCSVVGCFESVMAVNSPKYKKGLRIQGLSSEVKFSVFAAQYGTQAEELFITLMMRVGL